MAKIASGLRLAAAYAAAVFGAGFLLGTIRVLVVVPRIGARTAEVLELPVMVGACVLAAGWVDRRLGPGATTRERLGVGVAALVLVLAAEAITGVALRGVSLRDALVNPDPVSGSLYYLSLLLFAVLPAVRAKLRKRITKDH
jgi:hypothetical protein